MIIKIENHSSLKQALDTLCEFLLLEKVEKDRVFDSKLVACELLGNVFKHSQGSATLHGAVNAGFIELRILSDFPFLPTEIALPTLYSEHGRGLFLIQNVSEGIEPINGGVLVRIKI